ncbi:MAG: hypothetical protein V1926_05980 [Candidatus Peregrinibacteria bacterium]
MKHTYLAFVSMLVLALLVITTRGSITAPLTGSVTTCTQDSDCPASSVCFSGQCINTANIDQAVVMSAWSIVNAQYAAAIAACGLAHGDYVTAQAGYNAAALACQAAQAACQSSSSSSSQG